MTDSNNDAIGLILAVLVPLTVIFLFCGFLNFRYGWSEAFSSAPVAPVVPMSDEETAAAQQLATEAAKEAAKLKQEERIQILARIFPEASADDSSNANVFAYDPESKRYTPQPDGAIENVTEPSCSICLEDYNSDSVIMTAGCSHSYHRACILSWVEGHSDCPNCRGAIYDEDEFQAMREQLPKESV